MERYTWMTPRKRIALIAHDHCKEDLLAESLDFPVRLCASGPLGGDLQVVRPSSRA